MARPKNPIKHCVECGKALSSNPTAKRCADCYLSRKGIPSKARPKPTCEVCGKVVSKHAKKCIECWDKRGSRKAKPEEKQTYREPLADYEEARRLWSLEIGRKKDKLKKPPKAPTGKRQRYVVLPDVHAPFHDKASHRRYYPQRVPSRYEITVRGRYFADAYAFSDFHQVRAGFVF